MGTIVPRASAAKIRLDYSDKDFDIVFTNGCFDLLHIGHVKLLRQAAKEGAVVVVGINSDRSVRASKGNARPIIPEIQRASIVAAIEGVDFVIIFDEDTPLELIKELQPDILVKGQDWETRVVGEEEVENWGGKVVLISMVPDCSTSKTIALIVKRHRAMEDNPLDRIQFEEGKRPWP